MPSTKDMTARRDLFYPQFLFHMLSILLLSLLLILIDRQINLYIYKNEINYSVLIIPCYLILYVLYSQACGYFRNTSRISYMTVATLCFPYLHIGLILLSFYYYNIITINLLMLSQAFSAFLIVLPCFRIIFREIGVRFSFYNIEGLVSDIKLGFPLVLGFIVDFILAGSDRYLIAFYMTVTAVGNYNPGYVLGSVILIIPKAMYIVISLLMSKAVDNNNEYEAHRILNYALKIFLLLGIPFTIGSAILGRQILEVIANNQVADNAWLVVPIVAFGSLFCGLSFLFSSVLFVQKKTIAMLKVNLTAAIFNLLSNFILLYFFRDIIVAAVTTLSSYFIAFIYINNVVKKEDWQVDFQPIVIIKLTVASLVMGILLFWFSFNAVGVNTVGMLAGEVTLGIAAYIGGVFTLGTFSKKELQFMKSWVCR